MFINSDGYYQLPSLNDIVLFSPNFLNSLSSYVLKYQKEIDKMIETKQGYEILLKNLELFTDAIVNTCRISSKNDAINQIHKPLIQNIVDKLKNVITEHDLIECNINEIKNSCIDLLGSEIEKFKEFSFIIEKLNKLNKMYFEFVIKKYESDDKHNLMYQQILQKYRYCLLNITYNLRINVRYIDETIFLSSNSFYQQIIRFNKAYKELYNVTDEQIALDFIMKNNERESSLDKSEFNKISYSLNLSQISSDDDIVEKSNSTQILSKHKLGNFMRNAAKNILKEASSSSLARGSKSESTNDNFFDLNLQSYMVKSIPNFVDSFKYDIERKVQFNRESFDYCGYVCVQEHDLPPPIQNDKLIYLMIDRTNGYLYAQGYDDKNPVPLFCLAHSKVQELNDNTGLFVILTHNHQIKVQAPTVIIKDEWVEELYKGIVQSLDKIKYKIRDYHISADIFDTNQDNTIFDTPMQAIYSLMGNDYCVDCSSDNPEWVNYHQGVTICSDCAGAHRHFGSNNNHVRSLIHDYWNDKNIQHMLSLGNLLVNKKLEESILSVKPTPFSSMEERIEFVKIKYHTAIHINK